MALEQPHLFEPPERPVQRAVGREKASVRDIREVPGDLVTVELMRLRGTHSGSGCQDRRLQGHEAAGLSPHARNYKQIYAVKSTTLCFPQWCALQWQQISREDGKAAMFTLDRVVPWGRSFDEYRRMFALTEMDLRLKIAGCGDGPAGFNAEATRRGTAVVSFDPIYRWDVSQIRERIAVTSQQVLDETRRHADQFVWDAIHSVEELAEVRMAAMREFLADYSAGKIEGRYIEAELPTLPCSDKAFDLALCSHLLFLYSSQLGEGFHQSAAQELCRVAREVRVFPLLALSGGRSPYVDGIVAEVRALGREVSIERVEYEFQRGGNEMMRIRAAA